MTLPQHKAFIGISDLGWGVFSQQKYRGNKNIYLIPNMWHLQFCCNCRIFVETYELKFSLNSTLNLWSSTLHDCCHNSTIYEFFATSIVLAKERWATHILTCFYIFYLLGFAFDTLPTPATAFIPNESNTHIPIALTLTHTPSQNTPPKLWNVRDCNCKKHPEHLRNNKSIFHITAEI